MSDSEELAFANEFPPATREAWLKLVDGVLKGAPFEKRLVSRTYDDLTIQPLYARAADAQPVAARAPGAPWTVTQRVDHPDPAAANKQALHDLESGATGLTIVCKGSINANGYGLDSSLGTLERVLDGIYLDAGVTIDFNLSLETRDAAKNFAALVKKRGIAPESVDMRAALNPLGHMAATGSTVGPWKDLAPYFAGLVKELAGDGFRGPFAVADGRVIHNAGGSEAQELAFALGSAVTYLRALEAAGVALDAAARMIYFRLAADADQFLTIAKFRAIRKLWARVEQACGLAPAPAYVSAETAWRMMTRRDPYVNILRSTVAVFAAGVGGADAITVLPFMAAIGLPDGFARRVARNTQLVLLEESNLAKVSDPTAGSGAIEDLTQQLCTAAWTVFQEIEKAGGAPAALEKELDPGEGRRHPRRTREECRTAQGCAHRHERISEHSRGGGACGGRGALPHRPSYIAVRRPAAHSPRRAVRATARCLRPRAREDRRASKGVPRQSRQALRFHCAHALRQELLRSRRHRGCHQRRLRQPRRDDRGLQGIRRETGVPVLVRQSVCHRGCRRRQALKAAGAQQIYLAGRPGEIEGALKEAGITGFIFVGCDVIAMLAEAQASLGILG